MAEEFRMSDSSDFNAIVRRQIDVLYDNLTHFVCVSFDGLPDDNCPDEETWKDIVAVVWYDLFLEILKDTGDILKCCIYYTGLVGKFHQINLSLSLENTLSLLRDRLTSSISDNILHKLNKLASFILFDMCQISASDICFSIDCHTHSKRPCDNSGRMTNLFNEDLPSDEIHLLIYHISVKYIRNVECKLDYSSSSNLKSETESRDSSKDIKDKSEELKSSSSPNQSRPSTKISPDSKSSDPWQKYGAKPKKKLYRKSYSDATERQEESKKLDSPQSPPADPRLSEDYRRARNRSRLSNSFNRVVKNDKKDSDKHIFQESSGSYFPPRRITESDKPCNNKSNASIETTNLDPLKSPHYSPPSSSSESSTKCIVSPSKDTESSECLTDESSVTEHPQQSKSDSVPFVPFTETPEHKLLCSKFGARVDEHGNRRCCNPSDKRKKHKADEILQGLDLSTPDELDVICPPDFSQIDLGNVFKSEKELAEIPEELRKIHKAYEQAVINMIIKSPNEPETSSSDPGQLAEGVEATQALPPQSEQEAVEIRHFQRPKIELDVRGLWIRYRNDIFFENYRDTVYTGNVPPLSFPADFFDKLTASEFSDQAAASIHDEQSSGLLVVKTFADKMSFCWEQHSPNKEFGVFNQSVLQGMSPEKSPTVSTENVPASDKSMTSEKLGEMCDSAFASCIQQDIDNISPKRSEHLQSSTHEDNASEIPTKYSEIEEIADLQKRAEEINTLEYPGDEQINYISDVSSNVSDDSDSLGSVSELEDDDKV